MCAELLPEAIELDDWGYPIVRDGIAQLLNGQTHMEMIAEAEDAESAARQLRDQTFELLVVDISMPGLSGLDHGRPNKAAGV